MQGWNSRQLIKEAQLSLLDKGELAASHLPISLNQTPNLSIRSTPYSTKVSRTLL